MVGEGRRGVRELIAEAKRFMGLAKKATSGPWESVGCGEIYARHAGRFVLRDYSFEGLRWEPPNHFHDAELAASAPEMAKLLDEMADALEELTAVTIAREEEQP